MEKILHELNIVDQKPDEAPLIVDVYNKIDLLSPEDRSVLMNQVSRRTNAVAISAQNGDGIEILLQWIYNRFQNKEAFVQKLVLNNNQGMALAWCYQQGLVLERHDDEISGQIDLKLFLTASQLAYLKKVMLQPIIQSIK